MSKSIEQLFAENPYQTMRSGQLMTAPNPVSYAPQIARRPSKAEHYADIAMSTAIHIGVGMLVTAIARKMFKS